MPRHKTHWLLACLPPEGEPEDAPRLKEALEHAKRNPQLQEWLRRERQVDALAAEKLRSFSPPETLFREIIQSRTLFISRKRAWGYSLAALCLSVLFLGMIVARTPSASSANLDFAEYVAEVLPKSYQGKEHVDLFTNRLDVIYHYLEKRGAPVDREVLPKLRRLSPNGCKTLAWRGKKASLICIPADGHDLHLIIIRAQGIVGGPGKKRLLLGVMTPNDALELPRFDPTRPPPEPASSQWAYAAWRQNGLLYLFATDGGPPHLRKYL